MSWIFLALLSALCLGFYDISKKRALTLNSVVNVLFLSVSFSSVLLLVPYGLSFAIPSSFQSFWFVPHVDPITHLFIFLKALLVLCSWVFSYIAIKHLPLSLVSPMQATRPIWTLLGALFIYQEVLSTYQWIGVLLVMLSIFWMAWSSRRTTGTSASSALSPYYICLALAILTGAASGLYDKYMMCHYDHNAVQVYYTFYQTVLMLPIFLVYHRRNRMCNTLQWTWSIPCISICLVLSDYVYLLALSNPASLISVVSTIRRCGTIIPFVYGLLVLHESHPLSKSLCLLGILLGLLFLLI